MSEETKDPIASLVMRMVSAIEGAYSERPGLLERGDVAKLRRMDIASPVPAFWKLVAKADDVVKPGMERRWAFIAKGIALMAPLAHGPIPPGAALAKAGWSTKSDLRISRLLKATDESFEEYAESAVRFAASRGVKFEWVGFAKFLLFRNENEKNRFARDFYISVSN